MVTCLQIGRMGPRLHHLKPGQAGFIPQVRKSSLDMGVANGSEIRFNCRWRQTFSRESYSKITQCRFR